jgi:hypothetical protein
MEDSMRRILAGCTAVILAACTTTAADTAETMPDPRQGKEVRQICFSEQIRNWRPHDSRSVIVEKGFKEEYKVELVGTCQPQDAFTSIGLISRVGGGLCLSAGDRLVTDARYNDGTCTISRIYEWHKDAGKPAAG